nr:hypothetical protein [Tanacetum cinerariifolium]
MDIPLNNGEDVLGFGNGVDTPSNGSKVFGLIDELVGSSTEGGKKMTNFSVTLGSSSNPGFPWMSEVAGTVYSQNEGLKEGNTFTIRSTGPVAEVTTVPSDTLDTTSAPGNDGTLNEVGHESVLKQTPTSYPKAKAYLGSSMLMPENTAKNQRCFYHIAGKHRREPPLSLQMGKSLVTGKGRLFRFMWFRLKSLKITLIVPVVVHFELTGPLTVTPSKISLSFLRVEVYESGVIIIDFQLIVLPLMSIWGMWFRFEVSEALEARRLMLCAFTSWVSEEFMVDDFRLNDDLDASLSHKDNDDEKVNVTTASITLVSCDGRGGYDWSDQEEEGPNYALMAFSSSSSDSKVSDDEKYNMSQPKIEKKTVRPSIVKKEFVKYKQQEKTARKAVKQVEHHRKNTHSPRDYKEIDGGYVAFGGNLKGWKIKGKCTIKTGKFDGKADKGFFVGYSLNSKSFRIFNSRTRIVEENLHTRFSKSTPNVVGLQSNSFAVTKACNNAGQTRKEIEPVKDCILLPLWTADPPFSQDPKSSHDDGFKPSSDEGKKVDEDPRKENECNYKKKDNVNNTNNVNTISSTVNDACTNEDNELPFDPNIPALEDVSIFNFSNDDEDDGAMADMNNLDTTIQIEEEVYVCQPLGFEDLDFSNKVYKVEKALYGLHQAPRALYETLSTYLLDNGLQRGEFDKTLFIKRHKGDILLVQVYVDDIIFEVKTASTPMETQKPLLKDEDGEEVDVHMYRYQVNPKVLHLHVVKRIFRYLKGQPKLGLWYAKDSSFDLVAYTDSDYVGASLDRSLQQEVVNSLDVD